MYIRLIYALVLSAVVIGELGHAAGVTSLTLATDAKIEAPRWMFDASAKVKPSALSRTLVDGKRALIAQDRPKCLRALRTAYVQAKALGPWILWNHLQCAILRNKDGTASVEALSEAIKRADQHPTWLLNGPATTLLRGSFTAALLALTGQQIKTDRRSAWLTIDRLRQVKAWLNADDRANLYHWAGELAFIEQNFPAAQDFMVRSLLEKDNAEVRARVASIRSSLLGKSRDVPAIGLPKKDPVGVDDLGVSDEERDVFSRMQAAAQTQDFLPAIEDGIELLVKFPGGRRAGDAANQIQDIYLALANRSEDKFRHVRESAANEMLKADSTRLGKWAVVAYNRGVYGDAQAFAERAMTKLEGQGESNKMYLLAGRSALAVGDYDSARRDWESLLKRAGGTTEAAEAGFRLGLLEFRQKKYAAAAANFERLLALKTGKEWEYRALYWQWRAQQKMDMAKSAVFADNLLLKYAQSYYGLRAKAEIASGELEFNDEPVVVHAEVRLLDSERLAWERFTLLLGVGWFREAERELESLPDPVSNEERLVRAKYWAATMRYDLAIPMMNKALDEKPEWLKRSFLGVIFPNEYTPYVTKASVSTSFSPEWILSVIRQESSFRPEARSPSNAFGVMQLVPPTALELAKEFKLKDYSQDSLLIPEVNIRLGAVYLSRLTRQFSGHLPLSLAAYNAGPTRVRRWLQARKDLSGIESSRSSTPEDEIWIDELPWEETSHYVKSILRNWMLYRIVGAGKLKLSEPIWMDARLGPR